MNTLAGYTRTGRQLLGPGSDLVEVQKPDGSRLTAIVFHPEYRSHNAINAALHVVTGFLESPMVSGLGELVAHDREQAAFLYATGQAWSVAEVTRTLSDLGESGGARAGLELLAQAGTILVEAAEAGESAGVYSHGGLTPWRVMLDGEGRVNLIGHALPQVEILVFHESPDRIPREDAFRYCPPERMEARRENFTSDLFGLALIAFELMTGRPVYDGLINDIRTKAARGETSRRLQQFKDALPQVVREVLTTVMRPEIRDRFASGADFLEAVENALADRSVTGPTLREVMVRVSRHQPRARQELDPARTAMLSKEELKRLAQEEDEDAPRAARTSFAPPPRGPAARAAGPAAPVPAPPPAPVPAALTSSAAGLPAARRPPRLGASGAGAEAPAPSVPTSLPARTPPSARAEAPVVPPPPSVPTSLPARTPPSAARAEVPAPPASRPGGVATAVPTRSRLPPEPESALPGGHAPPLPSAPAFAPPSAAPPTVAPPVVPAAEPPPSPPMGAPRLPPGRRPGGEAAAVVDQILTRSGDSAREIRDRVERAMRNSGGAAAPPAAPPAPAAPSAGPRPTPVGAGDFVEVEFTGARPMSRASEPPVPVTSVPVHTPAPVASPPRFTPPPPPVAPPPTAPPPPVQAQVVSVVPAPPAPEAVPVPAPAPAPPPVATEASVVPAPAPTLGTRGPARAPLPPPPPIPEDDEDPDTGAGGPVSGSPPVTAPRVQPQAAPPTSVRPPPPVPGAAGVPAVREAPSLLAVAPPQPPRPAAGAPVVEAPPARPSAPQPSTPARASSPSSSAPPSSAASPPAGAAPAFRAPVALRAPARGEPVAVRFARAPGLKGHRRRLPEDTTLAEAAQQLVGQLVPVRCAADGRLLGWYRIGTPAGPLPVDATVGTLDDEETHVLHFVENKVQWLRVVVSGQSLHVPVGTAVPVASLVDAFALQFGLAEQPWQLCLDGHPLDDFHILADHAVSSSSVLELRPGSDRG